MKPCFLLLVVLAGCAVVGDSNRDPEPRPSAERPRGSVNEDATTSAPRDATAEEAPVAASEPPPAPGRGLHRTEAFVVDHPANAEAEARQVGDWVYGAIAAMTEFTGLGWSDVVGDGAVRLRIAAAEERRITPGAVEVRSKFTGLELAAEIELLSPAAHPATVLSAFGEPFEPPYFRRAVTRAVGVLYVQRIRRLRPGGFSYEASPKWFQVGVAEWFGIELGRGAPPPVLWDLLRARAGRVEAHPAGLRVGNDLVDGTLLLGFLAKGEGRARLRGLLMAPEADFYGALQASFGVTPEELAALYAASR